MSMKDSLTTKLASAQKDADDYLAAIEKLDPSAAAQLRGRTFRNPIVGALEIKRHLVSASLAHAARATSLPATPAPRAAATSPAPVQPATPARMSDGDVRAMFSHIYGRPAANLSRANMLAAFAQDGITVPGLECEYTAIQPFGAIARVGAARLQARVTTFRK